VHSNALEQAGRAVELLHAPLLSLGLGVLGLLLLVDWIDHHPCGMECAFLLLPLLAVFHDLHGLPDDGIGGLDSLEFQSASFYMRPEHFLPVIVNLFLAQPVLLSQFLFHLQPRPCIELHGTLDILEVGLVQEQMSEVLQELVDLLADDPSAPPWFFIFWRYGASWRRRLGRRLFPPASRIRGELEVADR
jgi:hypothetical protein